MKSHQTCGGFPNMGTPKSNMLIGTSITIHLLGYPHDYGNLHVDHWGKRIPTEHISQDGTMVEDSLHFPWLFHGFPHEIQIFPIFPWFSHGFSHVTLTSQRPPRHAAETNSGQAEGATRRHARRKQRTKTCPSSALQRHGSSGCGVKGTIYPLVNCHVTMENHHFSWENSLFLWPFSIANW